MTTALSKRVIVSEHMLNYNSLVSPLHPQPFFFPLALAASFSPTLKSSSPAASAPLPTLSDEPPEENVAKA